MLLFFWFSPGEFVDKVVSKSPTRHFIIHARKALLSGLSPAENRKVPPLKYVFPSVFKASLKHRLSAKALHAQRLSRRLALDSCGVRLTAEASKKRRFGVQIAPNRAWQAPYEEASTLDSGKTQENRREKKERESASAWKK